MTKISRTSSIHRKRLHNDYVERNHSITSTGTIDRIKPVNPTENSTDYGSSNYLIASDIFYDKLKALSEEYRRFYHNERALEKVIENIDDDVDKLADRMEELVVKYNKAINSLVKFDNQFRTNHIDNIRDILSNYTKELSKVGISIVDQNELEIDLEYFTKNVINSEDAVVELFKPIRVMILRLYKSFKNIKVPKQNSLEKEYNDYEELSLNDYSGLLLDNKS
ncbi:hypothetical protein [Sporosalibacterium faouarense]|uniref:hypothetical protein n=1 Tax=Sporosalibacterium faouarense TaxID=516123 RepID=UPI00141CC8CD|nr:hypothetical protein [Sporosalibacterium faouarense]MTI47499.1 hypothetical protein [Bacillota bacterium]